MRNIPTGSYLVSQLGFLFMNTMTNKEKALFQLIPYHRLSLKEGRMGTQGRNWKQRPWRKAADLLAPLGFLCFPILPRNTCPGLTPPRVSWAFSQRSLIKKMPYRFASRSILMRYFLIEARFPRCLGWCQVDKMYPVHLRKLSYYIYIYQWLVIIQASLHSLLINTSTSTIDGHNINFPEFTADKHLFSAITFKVHISLFTLSRVKRFLHMFIQRLHYLYVHRMQVRAFSTSVLLLALFFSRHFKSLVDLPMSAQTAK